MNNKKKYNNTDRLFFLCIIGLVASLAWFSVLLYRGTNSAKKVCQQIVSLDGISYDEDFLSEAQKLSGIRSVSPVRRISVRLRAGDYSMDTELVAVDLDEFLMKGKKAADMPAGSNPVLLIGQKSLAGMTDSNGHSISEKKQDEFLTNFTEITWQYQLTEQTSADLPTTSGSSPSSDSGSSLESASAGSSLAAGSEDDTWLPCQVVAVLSAPSDAIYISYDQAPALTGLSDQSANITEILLTVQGENNMEKALEALKTDET